MKLLTEFPMLFQIVHKIRFTLSFSTSPKLIIFTTITFDSTLVLVQAIRSSIMLDLTCDVEYSYTLHTLKLVKTFKRSPSLSFA